MGGVKMTFETENRSKVMRTLEDLDFPETDSDKKAKGCYDVEYYRKPGLDEISYPETAWKRV